MYEVLVNTEGQHSLWPAGLAVPLGWRAEGKPDTKEACLAHIKEMWTDMRPLSLRFRIAGAAASPQ